MTRRVVVDGTNMLIRSFAAYPDLTADDGFPTGAVYGMVTRIREAIELFTPASVLVCWDGGRAEWRRRIFPGYKQRPRTGETSKFERGFVQKPVCAAFFELMGVPQIEMPGVEADDLIAWAVIDRWADDEVQILTTDRDFYQLVSERVGIYGGAGPGARNVHLRTFEKEVSQPTPMRWHLFRILNGDGSDMIPRVAGLSGEKRFLKVYDALRGAGYKDDPVVFFVDGDVPPAQHGAMDHRQIWDRVVEQWPAIQRNVALMDLRVALLCIDDRSLIRSKVNAGVFDVDAFFEACEKFNFQSVLGATDRWRSALASINQGD